MRYLLIGCLIVIGLLLVARVDLVGHDEPWAQQDEHKQAPFMISLDSMIFWEAQEGLAYQANSISPKISQEIHQALDSLSDYLKATNHKMVLLRSSYQEQEGAVRVAQHRFIFRDSLISDDQSNFSHIAIVNQPED